MAAIAVSDLAYVRFAAPDMDVMARFLTDFGLSVFEHGGRLYGAGSDDAAFVHVTELGDPAFLALGFRAQSLADLETLAHVEGKDIVSFDGPGGGQNCR
jgi:hypothetical protein